MGTDRYGKIDLSLIYFQYSQKNITFLCKRIGYIYNQVSLIFLTLEYERKRNTIGFGVQQ